MATAAAMALAAIAAMGSLTGAPAEARAAHPAEAGPVQAGAPAPGPRAPLVTAVPAVPGHAPAWFPEARTPFPGGPIDPLNIWLRQGEDASLALTHEHPKVLFVGDSITQWWTTNGRVAWNRWFAPLGAADDGVVGDTTSNLLARVDAGQVPPASPRVVVLMVGTNNIALGQSPHDIVRGIESVVSALHRAMPASRMVVLGLLPRDRSADAYRAETVTINRLLRRAVRPLPYVSYLDVGPALLGREGRFLHGVMLPDFLHPSAAGYARISGPILRAVEKASS